MLGRPAEAVAAAERALRLGGPEFLGGRAALATSRWWLEVDRDALELLDLGNAVSDSAPMNLFLPATQVAPMLAFAGRLDDARRMLGLAEPIDRTELRPELRGLFVYARAVLDAAAGDARSRRRRDRGPTRRRTTLDSGGSPGRAALRRTHSRAGPFRTIGYRRARARARHRRMPGDRQPAREPPRRCRRPDRAARRSRPPARRAARLLARGARGPPGRARRTPRGRARDGSRAGLRKRGKERATGSPRRRRLRRGRAPPAFHRAGATVVGDRDPDPRAGRGRRSAAARATPLSSGRDRVRQMLCFLAVHRRASREIVAGSAVAGSRYRRGPAQSAA